MGEPALDEVVSRKGPDRVISGTATSFPIDQSDSVSKSGHYWVALLACAAVLAIVYVPASRMITNFLYYERTDDAQVGAPVAVLSAKVGGVVNAVLFENYSKVKKGDVLVRIDRREFETVIRQIETEIQAAQFAYKSAKRQIDRGAFDNIVQRRESELQGLTALLEDAKGDLDRGEFDTIVRRRRSELDSARALLLEAERDLERGEFDTIVSRRQSELDSQNALLEDAKKSFDRAAALRKQELISSYEFESAQASYFNQLGRKGALESQLKEAKNSAEKARDTAVANFRNHRGKVESLKAQLREAELAAEKSKSSAIATYQSSLSRQAAQRAHLKEALIAAENERDAAYDRYHSAIAKYWILKSQLEQARLNLDATEIRAPADGVVGKRQVEPGMVLRATQSVTSFVDGSKRWVIANFKETQLRNLRPHQSVEVEIDAIKNHIFRGSIESLSPASGATFAVIPPDNATGNFVRIVQRVPIKIAINPDSIRDYEEQMRVGLSATVRVRVGSERKH